VAIQDGCKDLHALMQQVQLHGKKGQDSDHTICAGPTGVPGISKYKEKIPTTDFRV